MFQGGKEEFEAPGAPKSVCNLTPGVRMGVGERPCPEAQFLPSWPLTPVTEKPISSPQKLLSFQGGTVLSSTGPPPGLCQDQRVPHEGSTTVTR